MRDSLRWVQAVGLLALLFCLLGVSTLPAQEITATFEFYESTFLPTFVSIQTREAVEFVWEEGDDVLVTSGDGPDDADAGEVFEFELTEDDPSFVVIFNDAGSFSFFDAEKDDPIIGSISVEPFEHDVAVLDNEFDPIDIAIFAGDQIRWTHIDDILHTVTSGVDLDDPDVALLFDEESSEDLPVFTYIFEEPGFVPYFCVPHISEGMVGSILIQRLFIRGEVNGDGRVDVSDAIGILLYLFIDGTDEPTCLDALDVNDNGKVTIGDALRLLAGLFEPESGDAPAAPWPTEGPDRTDDDFLCE